MGRRRMTVGYVRVSSEMQAKTGESLETQRQAIAAYARGQRLRLGKIFADAGISGRSIGLRPELQRLLALVHEEAVQRVVIHRLSRLGRNAQDLHNIVALFRDHGVALVSIKERIDLSTSVGRVMFAMLSAMAEFEREVSREQTTENRMAKWRRREIFMGSPPYGYTWNRNVKRLELVPEEAAIYQRVIAMYLDEGLNMMHIAQRLQEEGVTTRKGNPVGTRMVTYLLNHPVYTGEYVANRKEGRGNSWEGPQKPVAEHIVFPAPALISTARWQAVQAKIEGKRTNRGHNQFYDDYWLRGRLRCGLCGAKLQCRTRTPSRYCKTLKRSYVCAWHGREKVLLEVMGHERCPLPFLDAATVEDEVLFQVMGRIVLGLHKPLGAYIKGKQFQLPVRSPRRKERAAVFDGLRASFHALSPVARRQLMDTILVGPMAIQPADAASGNWQIDQPTIALQTPIRAWLSERHKAPPLRHPERPLWDLLVKLMALAPQT